MFRLRGIVCILKYTTENIKLISNGSAVRTTSCIHTSCKRKDLMEFFDKKENWAEGTVRVGRPWSTDELRLKGNEDLHKLWYVMLKERNMLMTMEKEYERRCDLFPSPERIEKVEESMENLLEVIQEREQAYHELETGEREESAGRRWVYNELGIGHWRRHEEHTVPVHMHPVLKHSELPSTHRFKWAVKFKKLYREKKLQHKARMEKEERDKAKYLDKLYTKHEVD